MAHLEKNRKLEEKNIEDVLALTPMQEGMLYYFLKEPESSYYFEQLSLEISGEIDRKFFDKAWSFVIRTNEMLRTLFRWENVENPVQIILKEHKIQPGYYDFTGKESKEKRVEEIKIEDRNEKFDLREVPFRITLCKLDKSKYVMIISNHHILYDGWSNGIILREFFAAYDDLSKGKELANAAKMKEKFKEFVKWIQDQDKDERERFWRNYLYGLDTQTELPVKRRREITTSMIESYKVCFSRDLKDKIEDFVKNHKITLASLLYTAWGLLLYRYNNSDNVIFGTTVSGRNAKVQGIEEIVGLFINTLPLRIQMDSREKIGNLLFRIDKELQMREAYETTSLLKIKECSEIDNKEELFDSIVVIENYPLDSRLMSENSILLIRSSEAFGVNNYSLTVSITIFNDIEVRFNYNKHLFEEEGISKLANHLMIILEKITTGHEVKVTNVEIISLQEKKQILIDFNNTGTINIYDPVKKTILRMFEEQVERVPYNTALVYGSSRLTYLDLNSRSIQLAKLLRNKGVTSKSIVVIVSNPSTEMIIMILAVIKTGGAYLPVESEYPAQRLRYILDDSKAKIALTDKQGKQLMEKVTFAGEIVTFGEIDINKYNGKAVNLKNLIFSTDPVYVIYTSGTTGLPKGVLIKNENLFNYVSWFAKEVDLTEEDKTVLISSFAFDLGYTAIYPSILQGGELHLLARETYLSPGTLLKYIKIYGITYIKCTPSFLTTIVHCEDFSPGICTNLRLIVLGGEAINLKDVEVLHTKCMHIKVINHYGPTETTIGSVARFIDFNKFDEYQLHPTIGKPIYNTGIYILDKNRKLLPIGVPGELYIAGNGVALGYLNRPELTSERFIKNIFTGECFLYKTGDLARWHRDGYIEFLGRTDNQVKLRGYRIELSEIKSKLLKHVNVKDAVVISGDSKGRGKYIAAYFVPCGGFGKGESVNIPEGKQRTVEVEWDTSELRMYLAEELPGYMIPSYIVPLKKIPLTPNGKIDLKALPDPEAFESINNAGYVPPRNVMEETLLITWKAVLGRKNIGVNEDFFSIGGDSIKAIQIVSRLNKSGYKASIKDIFRHSSITRLAPYITRAHNNAEQAAITGRVPLTPIQKKFFLSSKIEPYHYNQAVLLNSPEGFREESVKAIFKKIQEHHDALRMSYIIKTNGDIAQINNGLDYALSLSVYDFRNHENVAAVFESTVNKIQGSINLETGPLMKLGLFHLDDGDRLLIVIHHLVIDTVSWRILFEDIGILFQQYQKGEPLVLPQKTDSFKLWAERLSRYANNKSFLQEKSYWMSLESGQIQAIKVEKKSEGDFIGADNCLKDVDTLSFTLNEEQTALLVKNVNVAFGTEINDILLTALGLAIMKTFGNEKILIAIEGHGREDIMEDLDISRTVGWFTCIYPILLDFSNKDDFSSQIKKVKETLRRVPDKGIGYGILKYLTNERHKRDIEFKQKPQVSFNYLGQFDTDVQQMPFQTASESVGHSRSLKNQRKYLLDVIGIVVKQKLEMSIAYNKKYNKKEIIETLLDHYRRELKHIISYCAEKKKKEFAPGNFFYKGLSEAKLDQLMMESPPEEIYPLTPMQQGILFHSLYDRSSSAYFARVSFRLHGNLSIPIVKKSFNQLFKRHQVLRSVFIYEEIESPVQLVLREQEIEFLYRDIREIATGDEQDKFIRDFKENDRNRFFNLSRDVLMRVAIIRVDEEEYVFILGNHHILIDGWCRGILISEFLEIYSSYLEKRAYRLKTVTPYRTYIQWLENQDNREAKKYWKKYLEGYSEHTGIPGMKTTDFIGEKLKNGNVDLMFDIERTDGLKELAGRNHVTLNTIINTIWGLLLAKYNGKQDVVFGVVVSGRPPGISGIESMVGLFTNTIPVRIRYQENEEFNDLLRKVQENSIESKPFHYNQLAEIQAECALNHRLFDHILNFYNYPVEEQLKDIFTNRKGNYKDTLFNISEVDVSFENNYGFDIQITINQVLMITFRYNTGICDEDFIKKIPLHFEEVTDQIIENDNIQIKDLTISHGLLTPEASTRRDDQMGFGF